MKKPTISDLAKAAGVSVTTVSHAFSGRRHVDPETCKRIERLADQLGYHPSGMARALRSGRTGVIALASSMPFAVAAGPSRLGFLMEIAASAAMSALTRDLALCLIPPHPTAPSYGTASFDGVILVEPMLDDPLIQHFEQRRTAIVSIGTVPGRPDIPSIDLRSHETACLLLNHLAEQGCRQIAALLGTSPRTSQIESADAYAAFVAQHGTQARLIRLEEEDAENTAYRQMLDVLRTDPAVDGVFASIDAFATGAIRAAHDTDRAIPEKLCVVTRYDGLRAKLSQPPLTAVDLYLPMVAEKAVELLLNQIDGHKHSVKSDLPKLIIRASSQKRGS
ncbi:substrate-binding domain-containing protein [Paracoccus laeviglucosivorans]|uniref:Transcriptional regulator, LacI family n=1 Tax=Paracoccus laeviglucosivorans TaxID=1197861 RepID=A0A521ER16_9RHOB|nr:substrate-binding domain-containing protein [Paracoccus laeviglucosivorans]SMO85550.1 transcriptional regulator, LacI family [Paracoccus laeviglucosivorans]